jgi:hypothetical protein
VPDLIKAIDKYIARHNANPETFTWTKSARDILQKLIRANSRLISKQNEIPRAGHCINATRSCGLMHPEEER